eukprot:tig00001576_g9369.t1
MLGPIATLVGIASVFARQAGLIHDDGPVGGTDAPDSPPNSASFNPRLAPMPRDLHVPAKRPTLLRHTLRPSSDEDEEQQIDLLSALLVEEDAAHLAEGAFMYSEAEDFDLDTDVMIGFADL